MDASIVIRTFNEARWLPEVLEAVDRQQLGGRLAETIIVDSGSTDGTLEIAERHSCRIVHIAKDDFTFGRSLNMGCDAAHGRALVFISGHCIPTNENWLAKLIAPLEDDGVVYTYGCQEGDERSRFSETQLFRKYYPAESHIPQEGFFCNNANAALLKSVWDSNRFDEGLTGLEDMELAKRLVAGGADIGYVADASVLHIHEESWSKIRTRYEREAVALQVIMPEVHVTRPDFARYFIAGVLHDWSEALSQRVFLRRAVEVVLFRLHQYWGTYRGNNDHRKLSKERKDRYFYPRV